MEPWMFILFEPCFLLKWSQVSSLDCLCFALHTCWYSWWSVEILHVTSASCSCIIWTNLSFSFQCIFLGKKKMLQSKVTYIWNGSISIVFSRIRIWTDCKLQLRATALNSQSLHLNLIVLHITHKTIHTHPVVVSLHSLLVFNVILLSLSLLRPFLLSHCPQCKNIAHCPPNGN